MKELLGSWAPSGYTGRGLDIFDDKKGGLVAHWFGYRAARDQAWMICVGGKSNDEYKLQCWHTWCSSNGPQHTESKCGTLTLTPPDTDGMIRVNYEPANSSPIPAFNLFFTRYFGGEEKPTVKARFTNSAGHDTAVPGNPILCTGFDEHLPETVELEVIEGQLTIEHVNTNGPWNPKIKGVVEGEVLQTGTKRKITIDCDSAGRVWSSTTGRDQCNFGIFTKELGEILRMSAYVRAK